MSTAPCTDCRLPCGSPTADRVRCGRCASAFARELAGHRTPHPAKERRLRLYGARHAAGARDLFRPWAGVG